MTSKQNPDYTIIKKSILYSLTIPAWELGTVTVFQQIISSSSAQIPGKMSLADPVVYEILPQVLSDGSP